MTMNVLFLCPHGAAKSTAAAAFLEREGKQRGLDLTIDNAGTDPDPIVNPIVADRLTADNLPEGRTPRRVTLDDLANADAIINIGCDIPELVDDVRVRNWLIPNFSDDADMAFASIEAELETLLRTLAGDAADDRR